MCSMGMVSWDSKFSELYIESTNVRQKENKRFCSGLYIELIH